MITTKELAALLTARLNGDYSDADKEYTNIHKYGLDVFYPNTRYEFIVEADEIEYKYPEYKEADPTLRGVVTNTLTRYICGVLSPLPGSEIEGANKDTYNTTVSASVDFIIPDCEEVRTVEYSDGSRAEMRLGDIVQLLIEEVLSSSMSEYITASDETIYYVGTRYSRTIPGTKTQMQVGGIALPISVYITYSIVATGVSSEDIKLKINNQDVYTTRFGIARRTEQQANVSSDSGQVSKMKSSATSLTLTFDSPYRINDIGEAIATYILTGELTPLSVTVFLPTGRREEDGKPTYTEGHYTMVLADSGINSELNLAASVSVRLVEEMSDTDENSGSDEGV